MSRGPGAPTSQLGDSNRVSLLCPLAALFAGKAHEGGAACWRCCLIPRTAARWGAGSRLLEANLSILAWREARASNPRQ